MVRVARTDPQFMDADPTHPNTQRTNQVTWNKFGISRLLIRQSECGAEPFDEDFQQVFTHLRILDHVRIALGDHRQCDSLIDFVIANRCQISTIGDKSEQMCLKDEDYQFS